MEPRTERVVLILADISGYTQFMLANQKAMVHGQMVITKLLEAIIREVEIPLEVKEIEGDAVFLYAIKPSDEAEWEKARLVIGRKLISLFEAFAHAVMAGSEFALCECPTCKNVDKLKLKIVVHSGEAVFHKVGGYSDISGVDVILAHKLLKNSIPQDEYVLMTEPAYRDIDLATDMKLIRGEEKYEGFGAIPTYTYLAEGVCAPTDEAVERLYANRSDAFFLSMRVTARGYFGQLPFLLGLRSAEKYGEIEELPTRPLIRFAMGLYFIALMPVLFPFAVGVQAYRTMTRSSLSARRHRT